MTKPVDLTPKFTIIPAEQEIIIPEASSFSDFVGDQYLKNPTIMQQGHMQSPDFVSGFSGWQIKADGTAEFQTVIAGAYVQIFVQTGIPTSLHINDIWYDSDDGNKPYRAAIAGAAQITAGEWELISNPTEWADVGDGATTKPANSADVTVNNPQLVNWLTSNIRIDTIFETAGRFYTTAGGTGSAVFGNSGAMLQPGATATSYARMLLYTTDYVFYNEPIFSCVLSLFNKGTLDGRFAVGLGDITVDGSGFTEVDSSNFCGFYLKKAGGAVTLAIFQQKDDDTYDFENDVSVVNNSDILELFMKVKSTGITYYYRRNGGALTTIDTLTTGNPHGKLESAIYFANTNMGDASNFQVQLKSVSYEK